MFYLATMPRPLESAWDSDSGRASEARVICLYPFADGAGMARLPSPAPIRVRRQGADCPHNDARLPAALPYFGLH
eukprot:SAG11_NODE_1541_length_4721_cov_6.831458_4_plen_75_part_00